MLANEIYNFITSSKLIESVFILFLSIFILIFIIKNAIIISAFILLISIILFVLGFMPLWLFSLLIILIGGELYNKIIKRGGLNG